MASTVNTPFVRSAAVPEVPVKPSPAVDTEILAAISPETLEDSYVYVHCYFENESEEMLIRIWRTTYLVDRDTGSRSSLVHAENISYAPMWTAIPRVGTYNFLLIFSALPKACTMFDLVEEVPQPGGFHIQNIARNQQDVYHVDI